MSSDQKVPLIGKDQNPMENSSQAGMNASLNRSLAKPALYITISQEPQGNFQTVLQTLRMIWLSVPNVANYFSLWILFFAYLKSSEMLGDENMLTAYALTFMWANALGYALIVSLDIGLMAMSSQAIGAKKEYLVSYYYQRTQVISFILIILLSVVMCFTGAIFRKFAQEEVADYSQQFMLPYLPSLFFYIIFDSTRNIFNAYTQFKIPNIIVLVTYCLHFVWCYLFTQVLHWGMWGLGLSRSITEMLNAIIILTVVKVKNLFPNVGFLWTRQAYKGWLNLLKFTLPMGSIIYMDWIASEMQTIFVAALHDEDAASGHSAFVSIQVLFVVFFLGLAVTIEPFVGQAIGDGKIANCKQLRKQSFIGSFILSIFMSIVCFLVETPISKAFTNTIGEFDNFVICYRIMNYLILHFYSLSVCMGAILRATGQQNSAFFLPLFYYFVLGIPLQYVFVFVLELGLQGSWFAYAITNALTAISYCFIIFRTDFDKQAIVVRKNMEYQLSLINKDAEDAELEQSKQEEKKIRQQELAKQYQQQQP